MMRSLFPNGPPGGELALEYYRVIGTTSKGWDEARIGLEKLVKAESYVMLYRRELAKHLTTREATRRAGIRALAALARQPDADKQLTMEAWRNALALPGSSQNDLRLYQEYLAVDPKNPVISERLVKAQRGEVKRQPLARDTVSPVRQRGLALLEEGNPEEAERTLAEVLEKTPKDPQIIGGLGLIRLRQGRHAEAKEFFERALGLDADNRSKWKSLITTATFWGLMRESSVARDKNNLDLAEGKARAALLLDPDNANGIALLGGIIADRGNLSEAEKLYRESIKIDPVNGSAIRGLIGLLSSQGRRTEAIALLDSLGNEHSEAVGKYASIRAGIIRDEADMLLAAGRIAEAEAMLNHALLLAPENPWVRFDLARLYQKQGSLAQGRALMKDGLEVAPDDPQTLHANALFLASLYQADEALLLLEKIPPVERTPSMLSLQQRMGIQSLVQQAAAFDKAGLRSGVLAALEHAGANAGDDPEFVNSVANAWVERGEPSRAMDLMHNLLARQSSPSAALRLRYASLLNRMEQDGELSSLLEQLAAAGELSGEEKKELYYIQSSLGIRRADALRNKGDYAAAREVLAPILEQDPENVDLLMALARLHVSARRPEQARTVYREILDHSPKNVDARLALAGVEREMGDGAAARREIETILAVIPADDLEARLNIAGQLVGMNDMVTARQIADQLMATTAGNARILVLYGRIAKAEGHYDEAMAYFKRAKAAESKTNGSMRMASGLMLKIDDKIHSAHTERQLEYIARNEEGIKLKIAEGGNDGGIGRETALPTYAVAKPLVLPEQTPQTEADEEIARMERRRKGYVATGYDIRGKPGISGVSEFTVAELLVEARIPLDYSGHVLVHVDPVSANAGVLPFNDDHALSLYGQIHAARQSAKGNTDAEDSLNKQIASTTLQSARGIAIAVGYETDDMRADIGTTPLGFPVQGIAGGFKINRSFAPFYYSLDLARRPVTSSLVSYAGARDPVTGEVWGGVRSNGASLWAGFDRGRFDAFASLGYHILTGRNVLTNTQFELRTGMNWEFIQQEDMRLSAGLAFTNWRYRENMNYYTFGHGGYYSPQSYNSLAIPLRLTGRAGHWSYLLKGSASVSASYEKDMPYYPTDQAMQALGGNPVSPGGNGKGQGFTLGGAIEYQIVSHLFVGGHFEIDRSEYYTPNFATFYLRYMFDSHTAPAPYPPDPARPYSRF